jgi:hypothetical protein
MLYSLSQGFGILPVRALQLNVLDLSYLTSHDISNRL